MEGERAARRATASQRKPSIWVWPPVVRAVTCAEPDGEEAGEVGVVVIVLVPGACVGVLAVVTAGVGGTAPLVGGAGAGAKVSGCDWDGVGERVVGVAPDGLGAGLGGVDCRGGVDASPGVDCTSANPLFTLPQVDSQ